MNCGNPVYPSAISDRFDPDKDATNRDRHDLPLIFGDAVMADPDPLIIPSAPPQDGEERIEAVGWVDGNLYTAVFVWRGDLPRFVSVRRSNPGEERRYRDPR